MNINLLFIFIILLIIKYSICCCKFRGVITPSLNKETNKPIKWQVNLECDDCIKGGKKQQKTIINNGKGSKFEFDLIPAIGKIIKKLKIKISSLERLYGLERTNTWILKDINFEHLHRFQFGHFSTFSDDKNIYLRLKFTQPLDENLLVKLEENNLKMQYNITIVEGKDRKVILANRQLTEQEWKAEINIDINLIKQRVINYMRISKQYPMLISVKAEEENEGKESSTTSDPKTPPSPPLPSNNSPNNSLTPPHHLPSCSSSSSSSTSSLSSCKGSPSRQQIEIIGTSTTTTNIPNNENKQINLFNNYFEDKCPVAFCNNVIQMKTTGSGKESIIFDKIKLREKKVFDALIIMPILQNGEYPEYIYYFKPKKRSLIKKVKSLFKKINLNKVEENEIEEEIINNEVDELCLNEGESFREGIR
ncbi:hypothetical protein Mgra_00007600 [Meloidogyne graminicola]|uniref:Uncharacterized protein n=1 Tax=Meloidogyne graminicola TaxID=189291 RepID=A0A8S9ZI66_9BILA|nr:hypothetical protein Mgra_00007600 [Meloidogyne graminicola]